MTFSFEVKADEHGMVSMKGKELTQANAIILVEDTLSSIGIRNVGLLTTLEVLSEAQSKRRLQQLAQVGLLGDFQKSHRPMSA